MFSTVHYRYCKLLILELVNFNRIAMQWKFFAILLYFAAIETLRVSLYVLCFHTLFKFAYEFGRMKSIDCTNYIYVTALSNDKNKNGYRE